MGGINFEYKYFTDQFIKWILSAATFVEKSSSRLENTLANLPVRVRVIISLSAANPITQSCCIGLQRALKHWIKAIQLRSKINKYFTQMYEDLQTLPSKAGADLKDLSGERHAHAINILQDCHDQLSRWFEQVKEASVEIERKQREEGDGGKYEGLNQIQNKFESLLLDDDEDEDEGEEKTEGEGAGVAEMDDVDEGLGEVRVKVICFGMDVVTCLEYVNEIWLTQLKQMQSIYGVDSKSKAINENKVDKEDEDGIGEDEEVSIITALAVTTVAFRTMDVLFGKLSSQVGGLENATNCLPGIFQTILSEAAIGRCPLATFFNEALEQCQILQAFLNQLLLPKKPNFIYFDRNSDEVPVLIEQYYELPNSTACRERFFFIELAALFNYFHQTFPNASTEFFISFPSTLTFLDEFLRFFHSPHTITLPLVLRCMCWWNVVQLMQSTELLNMGRWIYFMRSHIRKFMRFLSTNPSEQPLLASYFVRRRQEESNQDEEGIPPMTTENSVFCEYVLHHHNPILCGLCLLDRLVEYSCTASMINLYNRTNCLLYVLLKQEGYIKKPIPFFEFFVSSFEKHLFPFSTATMTLDPTASSNRAYNRGNYYENCIYKGPITAVFNLVSSKRFQDAQNSTCKLRKRKGRNRILEEVYGEYFSTLKTIIANHDLSKVIVSGSINVLQILPSVARIAQVEVYKSRILSFHSMKSGFLLEALNWEYFQEVSSFIKPVVMQQCNLKSIRSISYFVLSYITSNVASSFDKLSLTSPVPSKLVLLCTKLAEITERFLGSISLEEELFVLPTSQREFLEAHFGTISPARMIIDESREDMREIEEIFTQMNELLRENERELMKEVDYMKYRKIILQGVVKQDFRVLQICDENRLLSTMLDHSISGPLQDMDFAEWIIQMKGLYVRGAVNYDGTAIKRLVIGRVGERALSLSHLQQAILAKNNWAVDLILAATQGRDLQYREGKEDNSAIHLAVLARVMRNLREIMIYDGRCDEDPRQDEFWNDDDPLKRDRMKATVALMVDELHEDYMKRGEALQLLQEKRTLTAKKGKVNHRRGGRGEEEELVIAREEWKRAADAERELLASEEIEKANEEARKGNGGTKQKKGGKKKK